MSHDCYWDLAGINRLNGTQQHLRIDYSCDGLCVRFSECEAKLVCATEHEMGAGVGDVRPADGWCTAEELAAWLALGQWEKEDYVLAGRTTHNCQTFVDAFRDWFSSRGPPRV